MDMEPKAEAGQECNCDCNKPKKEKSLKSKLLWMILFLAIAVLTVWAVTSQDGFTFTGFIMFLRTLHPGWVICAILAMLGFIVFEALAITSVVRSFGYRAPLHKSFIYSSSDIYFSAITPSATGGQPASAYFMIKDGIPGAVTTVCLIVNLIMYTFAILIIGITCFILKPSIFLGFPVLGKVLIIVGSVCLVSLAMFFILILFKSSILLRAGNWVISLLAKIRILRKPDKYREKLCCSIKSYDGYVEQLKGKQRSLAITLLFNVLQRLSVILVTLFVFFAAGGDKTLWIEIIVSQCMVILGTNVLPIPGAMGISDFMLICAFGAIGFSEHVAVNLNLISRGISFYSCVIICGLSMVIKLAVGAIMAKRAERKAQSEAENQPQAAEKSENQE